MNSPQKPVRVAITGGIGSGKSKVLNILNQMGYPTCDADVLSRKAWELPHVQEKIKKLFSTNDILDNQGNIVRVKVRDIVFKEKKALIQLEEILHPEIKKIYLAWIKELEFSNDQKKLSFYEASLIFEKQMHQDFDVVVLVKADSSLRKQRLLGSRPLTEESIEEIMASQFSDSEKEAKAHFVLENSGNEAELIQKIKDLIQLLPS